MYSTLPWFLGLAKHYNQDLQIGDVTYSVEVSAEIPMGIKVQKTELQYSCTQRGSNFLVTPAFLPYCDNMTEADADFMETVGHEFGNNTSTN